jgi:hypothetical protein
MKRGIENNKSEYRSEIKNNERQHDAATVQTAEIPEKLLQSSGIAENQRKYRGHKIDIIYTV